MTLSTDLDTALEAAKVLEADAQALVEQTPTPEEARARFAAQHDLAAIVTTEGTMHRDGTFG